ncbi:MAG: bifunctional sugar-1-phosphate nucleotidylyltransferase/acetyltransferase, partial [Candidatus Nanohalobium sp.]
MKAVILAAGESSRFRPLSDNRHKGLTQVLGKPIIEHTIEELRNAGVEEVIVVQGRGEEMEKALGSAADHYVVQEEPKGMGDALRQAEDLLDRKFLVLTPYRANAAQFFQPMIEKAEEEDAETVFVSTPTDEPEKYGILELDDEGQAVDLVEKPGPEDAPSDQKVVGMYLLNEEFFDYLDQVETWEYQYEDALSEQMSGEPASVLRIGEETNSIKYPWDLFSVLEELMEQQDRNISEKASIADSAQIKGNVIVEDDATIYENAVIKGPAYIGENATVGNNSLLRDHVAVEKGATVGANSEVKASVFQPGSSMHSGFIGDSIIGRNSKIGAGTITANRKFRREDGRPEISSDLLGKDYEKETGRRFMGAVIGENVDIGVNVSLMPGIQVGSEARIGPATVVHENVENGETVYVDQEQVRKQGER